MVRASRPVAAIVASSRLRPSERFPVVKTSFNVKTRGPRLDMRAADRATCRGIGQALPRVPAAKPYRVQQRPVRL